jgi:5-methylcytosine-specific restriction endonuclease McrA
VNSAMRPPSPEAQLAFLAKLQRLFAEGDFTATYKFALLISVADLAVELGADDGSTLSLSIRQIAERFISLYWNHTSPYGTGSIGKAGVLSQNVGNQAAVLTAIAEFRTTSGASTITQAMREPGYASLVTRVAATVSAQPLNYLQNFGGTCDPFLYERSGRGSVQLKSGIGYCLRRFYPLVQQLSRSHWAAHVKSNRRNQRYFSDAGDLEEFLFSASRQSLVMVSRGLLKLDGDRCFYCGNTLGDMDVDHFIPFSLYPRDLPHNFVLAHPSCNRSKSDSLAARRHLERWLERITKFEESLLEIGASAGLSGDRLTVERVATWGYSNACAAGGNAWLSPTKYEPISSQYIALLGNTNT